jgi:hypothetical protein
MKHMCGRVSMGCSTRITNTQQNIYGNPTYADTCPWEMQHNAVQGRTGTERKTETGRKKRKDKSLHNSKTQGSMFQRTMEGDLMIDKETMMRNCIQTLVPGQELV